jgi:hypothetical protein
MQRHESLRKFAQAGAKKMATELYERMTAFDHGDAERNDLMRKVWDPTPWMVDAYTGSYDDPREDRKIARLVASGRAQRD